MARLEVTLSAATEQDQKVLVVPVGEMTISTYRLHLAKRHPRIRYEFIFHHALDHRTNPDLDHIHEGEQL